MKNKTCARCGVAIEVSHSNQKRCAPCVEYLKKKPGWRLNPEQEEVARALAGRFERRELAKELNTSLTNLKRWARDNEVSLDTWSHKEEMVQRVTAFYEQHGLKKTQESFPELRVRSIVEHNKHAPRQVPWTDKQIIEAARMSCFVSFKDQATYFNRPRANAGSIRSLWSKKMLANPTQLHGLAEYKAKMFVSEKCPSIKLPLLVNTKGSEDHTMVLYLWVDMEKHLLPEAPEFIKKAIITMAEIQRWIWGDGDIPKKIYTVARTKTPGGL